MGGVLKSGTEIAMALIGVATLALLVSQAGGTTKIIESAGNTFQGLLATVTLQNGYGNAFGGSYN